MAIPSKPNGPLIGAPSQLTQSSRKSKRAWRKNIDLQQVEDGLEELRVEERVVGCDYPAHFLIAATNAKIYLLSSTIHSKKDEELFQLDVKGDDRSDYHHLLPLPGRLSYFNSSEVVTTILEGPAYINQNIIPALRCSRCLFALYHLQET